MDIVHATGLSFGNHSSTPLAPSHHGIMTEVVQLRPGLFQNTSDLRSYSTTSNSEASVVPSFLLATYPKRTATPHFGADATASITKHFGPVSSPSTHSGHSMSHSHLKIFSATHAERSHTRI